MAPSTPGSYALQIWRGTTEPPFIVELPLDGTDSEWRLKIALPDGTTLTFSTEDATLSAENVTIDAATWTRVTWPRTVEQSRLIPLGKLATYELEQVEPGGGQGVWLAGTIEGRGGGNDD